MGTILPVPQFARGDLVRWNSQGRGRMVHHVGVVELIVPPGMPLFLLLDRMRARYSLRAIGKTGAPRPEQSYLVALLGKGGRGKPRIHWPHASLLRPYESADLPYAP